MCVYFFVKLTVYVLEVDSYMALLKMKIDIKNL